MRCFGWLGPGEGGQKRLSGHQNLLSHPEITHSRSSCSVSLKVTDDVIVCLIQHNLSRASEWSGSEPSSGRQDQLFCPAGIHPEGHRSSQHGGGLAGMQPV